ncbi:hypothetical protein K493DRAFT_290000 [Basidiobolus meristosporus CBS 931.73]|uniref:MIT domain-containing protein n=1 Tax=Basidiobolus meristosporus CBS 931.73 TaxID=1314790 RepID=A0A1Y1XT42_9FUNG|nr:hypothetical protein K493DRAFT_290000 [Basidiobolus meristosporus CBS 931.73]|eukprot:ORX88921.1 hypothetical protein K493DRAFT_290000 [Basidiobolus meristosporus CBS 931.73]
MPLIPTPDLFIQLAWPLLSSTTEGQGGPLKIVELPDEVPTLISPRDVDQAIILSAHAVEREQLGDRKEALGYYLGALENLLHAMPVEGDAERKKAVAQVIKQYLAENEIDLEATPEPENGTISDTIINTAISTAVAIKQSPIPDAIKSTVNFTLSKMKKLDQAYGVREKAWKLGKIGVNKTLEIDQQYRLHQKISHAVLTGATAVMKAGIAYQVATPYHELKSEVQSQLEPSKSEVQSRLEPSKCSS